MNSTIEYKHFKFGTTKSNNVEKHLLFGKLNTMLTPTETVQPLKIEKIPLEEIHSLQRSVEATNRLSDEDVAVSPSLWLSCYSSVFLF